ncbi:MAG: hypothetical protein SFV23_23420 [Planctomycetaceae bacterium]|nr:hypothetical protein [Planctomycetaceae bacterium]
MDITNPLTAVLAAQVGSADAVAEASAGLPKWGYVLLFGLAILIVWGVLYLWERRNLWLQRTQATEHRTLFDQLCDAQELSAADRERLQSHARRLQLADPSLLFIDPRILESLAASDPRDHFIGVQIFGSLFEASGSESPVKG